MAITSPATRPTRRRQALLPLTVAAVIAVGAVGWLVGSRVRSAEDVAASAQAPEASWITVPVERRVLAATLVTRGDVVPAVATPVRAPASVAEQPVVTGVFVEVGDEVADGDRIVEVSGRPVFVVQSDTQIYRDMRPGMSGPDVVALQAALARKGCALDTDNGVYGQATKVCVEQMYHDAGYEPTPTSETEDVDLAASEQAVEDARAAYDSALQLLVAAQAPLPRSEELAAQQAVEVARRGVADAEAAYSEAQSTGADPTAARNAVANARDALQLAEARQVETLAPPDVSAELLAVGSALDARTRAEEALVDLQNVTGPTVPQGEVVFVPTTPARVESVGAAGPLNQGDGNGTPSTSGLLAQLSSGGYQVVTGVSVADAGLIRVGMKVDLLDEARSAAAESSVVEVATDISTDESGQQRYVVTVRPGPDADPIPPDWSNRNVRVTFTSAQSEGPVLVVPLAAVTTAADGRTRVQILSTGGEPVDVAVSAGLSADGFVEVAATADGMLHEGDLVVVGR
jgi:hypothetical protein